MKKIFFKFKIPLRFWVVISISVIIALLSYLRIFDKQELFFYDLQFGLRSTVEESKDIVIIEISDDTLANFGRWPLPRDYHADLVDALKDLGARAVVFDIMFSEPTLYDELLKESIKNSANVYLPLAFSLEDTPRSKGPALSHEILADILKGFKGGLAGFGHINVLVDSDGKIRRIPLFVKDQGALVPHLAFKVAADLMYLDLDRVKISDDEVIIDNQISLPVGSATSFLVNYPGRWETTFKHFSYYNILKSYGQLKKGWRPDLDLTQLKGKVCFVGLTANGTADIRANPIENVYPMVGLGASVLNSVLNGKFIRNAGVVFNSCLNIMMFLIVLTMCLKMPPLRAFLMSIVVALIFFIVSLSIFSKYGIWFDLFFPFLTIALTYTGVLFYDFLTESKKRHIIEKELDIASKIQRSFLPKTGVARKFTDLDISSFMQPAKFVAGDLYDFVALDENRLGIFIGDVSGKGVPASLIMAQTVSLFRVFARNNFAPEEVLTQLNKELSGILQGRFVTGMYLVIDISEETITGACAGHPPVILYDYNNSQVIEFLPPLGPPLGIMDDLIYKSDTRSFRPGDKLFFYTDGICEARNKAGNEYGIEEVREIISANSTLDSQALLDKIVGRTMKFQFGRPAHDDITAILVDFKKKL